MGQPGISLMGPYKGVLLMFGVILMWFCLKAGFQLGMRFIKPPMSDPDDSEGSFGSGSACSPDDFLCRALAKEAGKECGCLCLGGGWGVLLQQASTPALEHTVFCQGSVTSCSSAQV